jgi:diaminopimelate epimerase
VPVASGGAAPSPAAGLLADEAGEWVVDVPGGRLTVVPGAITSLLTGPAVIIAEGEISPSWLALPA